MFDFQRNCAITGYYLKMFNINNKKILAQSSVIVIVAFYNVCQDKN